MCSPASHLLFGKRAPENLAPESRSLSWTLELCTGEVTEKKNISNIYPALKSLHFNVKKLPHAMPHPRIELIARVAQLHAYWHLKNFVLALGAYSHIKKIGVSQCRT